MKHKLLNQLAAWYRSIMIIDEHYKGAKVGKDYFRYINKYK